MMAIVALMFIISGVLFEDCSGSTISLYPQPATIQPLLTPDLTLTCALNNSKTSATSGGLVGRRRRDVDHDHDRDLAYGEASDLDNHEGVDPEFRSVSDVVSTTEDIDYISSIILLKGSGEKVAMVTEHKTPILFMPDVTNAEVTGNVTGGNDIRGYLAVTWQSPTEAETGDYTCEITPIATDGSAVVFKTSLQVTATTPTIQDLIGHINDIKKDNAQLKNQMQQQSTKLQQQNVKLTDMEERFGHVETGTLSFYLPSDSFSSSDIYRYNKVANGRTRYSYMRYKDTTVAFSKPYTTPPSISWSVGFLNDYRKYLAYSVEVMSVSTKSFTLRVGVRHVSPITDSMFDDLVLQWTSIPK